MKSKPKIVAIIPAAGSGSRFGAVVPKQYIQLESLPILIHTLKLFENTPAVQSIIVATNPNWLEYTGSMIVEHGITKLADIVPGGAERQDSIYNALNTETAKNSDIIIIHDAVRPYVSFNLINEVIKRTTEFGAVVPALAPTETVKIIDASGYVERTLDRNYVRNIQTPQGFKTEIILNAYKKAYENHFRGTDDAALVEFAGYPVKVIEGEETNIKITSPEDIK